jgi:hypothetical protein
MFFLPIIIFGVFFIVFLIIGLSIFKSHKHTVDTMTTMITTVARNVEGNMDIKTEPKEESKICEYCGSSIPSNSAKCNSCGAKVKK